MFGMRMPPRKSGADEEEKPFWISYSDLMTALMVLFLVAMSISLFSITQRVINGPEKHAERIAACMADLSGMTAKAFPGVKVQGHTISFGTMAQFKSDDNQLDPGAVAMLRRFVPRVIAMTKTARCKDVFKRVVVEGYASRSGTYIHNLNLSLQRAERLLCVLMNPTGPEALTDAQRKDVRRLFLVGGRSFNDLKSGTPEQNQRIELTLEFRGYSIKGGLEKRLPDYNVPLDDLQSCPLDR